MADPLVGIVMGSQSDWETMRAAAEVLDELGVPHEVRIVSAHRTPDRLFAYAEAAAGAGSRRSSPAPAGRRICRGCWRPRPGCRCWACRWSRRRSRGLDSLLSIVQMPKGVPVGTLAIGAGRGGERRAAGGGDAGDAGRGARGAARRLAGGADRGGGRGARWRLSRCRPGSRIGILGGGQLGRMLAMAAARLGMRTHVFEPAADPCAAQVANAVTRAGYDDLAALRGLRRRRSTS